MRHELALTLLLVACEPEGPPPLPPVPGWPAGTVVVVDGEVVLASEVDVIAHKIGRVHPEYTSPHRRRLALLQIALPRAAARAAAPAAWEVARAACERARAALPATVAPLRTAEGTWRELDFGLWCVACELEPGIWAPPSELPGRWVLVRLDRRAPATAEHPESLGLSFLEFPYLDAADPDTAIRAAVDGARLEIVDPAWREIVPESFQYRLRGGSR